MAALSTLTDDFTDGTVDTGKWSGSYGDPEEAGGRGRVPCTTGYAALKSASTYTLTASGAFLRVYPPAVGGAASAACSILVLSSVGGTDAGFVVDTAGNAVGLYLRSGYADGAAVFLTYSAVDHAWLRIREDAGTLYWDTSADGVTWTNRRTATTPAWAADTDLSFLLEAHRDTGTNDFAEFDNVNIAPGQTAVLDTATTTDAAQSLTGRKALATALASETNTAQGLAATKTRPLDAAVETGGARPLPGTKTRTLGAVGETADARLLSAAKSHALTAATENSTAQPVTTAKRQALTTAGETSSAQALQAVKSRALDSASDVGAAADLAPAKSLALGPATAADTALTMGRSKTLALAGSGEASAARALTGTRRIALVPVVAADEARLFACSKTRHVAPAAETDTARALTATGGQSGDLTYAVATPRARWRVSDPWI